MPDYLGLFAVVHLELVSFAADAFGGDLGATHSVFAVAVEAAYTYRQVESMGYIVQLVGCIGCASLVRQALSVVLVSVHILTSFP